MWAWVVECGHKQAKINGVLRWVFRASQWFLKQLQSGKKQLKGTAENQRDKNKNNVKTKKQKE